jgi:sulfide:quinone oxidoreductase
MIPPRTITADLSVSGQVGLADLPEIARQFRTLVNNRPDGEEPGQANSADLEAAARRLGLDYLHLPVVPGRIDERQVTRFASALAESPRPILAFCRSGTRSASLWALSQAGSRSAREILAAAAGAGYDLTPLEPMLRAGAG